jgi:predicted O-linked N-acetylglucosamine transferase (SPINDLY family)
MTRLEDAVALHRAGRLPEAGAIYEEILRIEPRNADVWQFLGLIALSQNDLPAAVEKIRHAVALNPQAGVYHFNLGLVLRRLSDVAGAIASYRRAVELAPGLAEAHTNLGNCLRESGDTEGAVAACRRATVLRPTYADAHVNLGVALQESGRTDEAVAAYRRALAIKPDFAEAHYNLGLALLQQGKVDEAAGEFRSAIELQPGYVDAWNNFGVVLQAYGNFDAAVAAYRKAMESDPAGSPTAYRNIMGAALHMTSLDEPGRWEIAHGFEALYAGPIYARVAVPDAVARAAERRLRVGYVSSDLYEHPVGRNLEPVLAHRDRAGFDVICYADVPRPDGLTGRLQGLVDAWRPITGLSDEQVAGLVRADGVDVLVILAGRFDRNRPLVAAYKPAPVRVSFHDPGTSGLSAMEYLIADPVLVPRGAVERFSERVVRLPSFYIHAPLQGPEVGELPLRRRGYPTFGSFNNPAKVNQAVLRLWGEVLRAVPGARLKVKCKNWFANSTLRERFLTTLDVPAERVEFDTLERGLQDHLGLYHDVDVALDPFPFTGSTTTFEALWMGVPVVTLLGERMAGRWSASMLTALRLPELIARTPEEYVQITGELVASPDRLAGLRGGLRDRVAASPLCDGRGKARQVERIYRSLWRRWCRRADG